MVEHAATRIRRQRGFTMFELTCAMAMLMILASAAFVGFGQDLRRTRLCWQETIALESAANRLAELRAAKQPPGPGDSGFELASVMAQQLPGCSGRQSVTSLQPGLVLVKVEVCWRPAHGLPERSVALTTQISRQ